MQFPSLNAETAKDNYQLADRGAGYFQSGIARSIRADIVNKLRVEKIARAGRPRSSSCLPAVQRTW
jgi:hypothetical protein